MKQISTPSCTTFWERQSLLGKAAVSLFILPPAVGAFIDVMFANIVPNANVINLECALSIAYAGAWSILLEIANRERVWEPNQRGYLMLSRRWLRIPFTFTIGLMFGYSSFVHAYPWLITEIVGTKNSKNFEVTGWAEGGLRTCYRPEVGHLFFEDGSRAFCVSRDARMRMPPGTHLRIAGPETYLGINTDEIYILKSPPK